MHGYLAEKLAGLQSQARQQGSVATGPTTATAQPVAAAADPAIHARRLGPLAAPTAVTAPQEQLPYAEQDDDFVEFAKSLQRFPGGERITIATYLYDRWVML